MECLLVEQRMVSKETIFSTKERFSTDNVTKRSLYEYTDDTKCRLIHPILAKFTKEHVTDDHLTTGVQRIYQFHHTISMKMSDAKS